MRRHRVFWSQPLFSDADVQNWMTRIEKIVDLLWAESRQHIQSVQISAPNDLARSQHAIRVALQPSTTNSAEIGTKPSAR